MTENQTQAGDTSLTKPEFGKGQFDNDEADQPNSESAPTDEELAS